MKIPKIIHQTWKTEEIPTKWIPYQQRVKELHPDWEYRLWTDEDNDAFVQKEYPEFLDVFRGFPKVIHRVDVIRYLILYKMGGLYLDLDYEMLKPFDFAEANIVLPKNRSLSFGDHADEVGNCIIASIPGHPFWKDVVDDLHMSPPETDNHLDVIKDTGPLLLTRILRSNHYPDITTPDRMLFHPPLPRTKRGYEAIRNNNLSYGIHHCWGSWIEKYSWRHIKNAFGFS